VLQPELATAAVEHAGTAAEPGCLALPQMLPGIYFVHRTK
jgi:hypothetical protein